MRPMLTQPYLSRVMRVIVNHFTTSARACGECSKDAITSNAPMMVVEPLQRPAGIWRYFGWFAGALGEPSRDVESSLAAALTLWRPSRVGCHMGRHCEHIANVYRRRP